MSKHPPTQGNQCVITKILDSGNTSLNLYSSCLSVSLYTIIVYNVISKGPGHSQHNYVGCKPPGKTPHTINPSHHKGYVRVAIFCLQNPQELLTLPLGCTCHGKLDLCRTRWIERTKALAHFHQFFVYLEEALGVMVDSHTEENQENYPDFLNWDADTKSMARSFIKALDFEFLMSFTTTHHILAVTEGITTRLQSSSIDAYDAFCQVEEVNKEFKHLGDEVGTFSEQCYTHACWMGDAVRWGPQPKNNCKTVSQG